MKKEKIGQDICELGGFLYKKLGEMYPLVPNIIEGNTVLSFLDLPKYYEGLEGVEWVCKTNYPTLHIVVYINTGSGGIGYRNPKSNIKGDWLDPVLSELGIKEGDFDKKPLKVKSITEKLYYKK